MPGSSLATYDQPVPWRAIFQRLSLAYHWTPGEILELTPTQLALYSADDVEPEGTVAMSVQEGTEYIANRRAARETWVGEVLHRAANGRANVMEALAKATSKKQHRTTERPVPIAEPPRVELNPESGPVLQDFKLHRRGKPSRRNARQRRGARQAKATAAMQPAEIRSSVSPLTSLLHEPPTSIPYDAASVRIDELTHRLESIGRTAREIQAAVERIERRRSDVSQFG